MQAPVSGSRNDCFTGQLCTMQKEKQADRDVCYKVEHRFELPLDWEYRCEDYCTEQHYSESIWAEFS
jgi:hypothetical protein